MKLQIMSQRAGNGVDVTRWGHQVISTGGSFVEWREGKCRKCEEEEQEEGQPKEKREICTETDK